MNLSLSNKQTPLRSLIAQLTTLAGAELLNRLSRILAAFALARALGAVEFGIAAIALTSSDILRSLTQTGIGARIVSTSTTLLEDACAAAYRLNWWAYGLVAILQCAIAFPVGWHYQDTRITWLIICFAAPYLLYPLVAVQVFRVQRDQRMKETALMSLVLIGGDNILTAIFALSGFGLWSLALSRFICALLWVYFYYRLESWRPWKAASFDHIKSTLRFGLGVLAAEFTQAMRLNADKLLVGQLLGVALLGQYFFAFNAGIGLSTAMITTASAALLPHFSTAGAKAEIVKKYLKSLMLIYAIVLPILAVQILLAPYYVPLLFGEKWVSSVQLLSIMCLGAIPLAASRTTTQVLRSQGIVKFDAYASLIQFGVSMLFIYLLAQKGLTTIALSQIAINMIFAIFMGGLTIWTLRRKAAK